MRFEDKDLALLRDIYVASRDALSFVKGMKKEDFLKDLKTRRAVEREFEIMGEAAGKLSESARESLKDVPWPSVIGLRNILVHDYALIQPAKVWGTIQEDLPALQQSLVKISVLNPGQK